MRYYTFLLIIIGMIMWGSLTNCKIAEEGNFALATSQEPGPLFGFGQDIIEKKDLQAYLYVDHTQAGHEKNSNIMPGILYGIRDDLSIFLNIPISTLKDNTGRSTSAGISVQVEYAYLTKENLEAEIQATILAALSGPNGSMIKQAISNRQSSTFFLGGTFNYMSTEWYGYGALGEVFSIKNKTTKLGNNFLYQFGLGRNLHHSTDTTYLFLVEMLGGKFQTDSVGGIVDPGSGGNIIFIAPSFWFSSDILTIQAGLSLPIWQNFMGNQKYDYQVALNLSWTF